MERSQIKGYTIHILGYSIEFVVIDGLLSVVAIYGHHNRKLIKRFEV